MQIEKEATIVRFENPEFRKLWQHKNAHFVFVTGDNDIHTVFDLIKLKLKTAHNSCLTLIYSTSACISQPLFKAELEYLEKRFPSKLITHYLFSAKPALPENTSWLQQILEIVINSNTSTVMPFLIIGDEDLSALVSDRLHFLGIKSNHIYSHISI